MIWKARVRDKIVRTVTDPVTVGGPCASGVAVSRHGSREACDSAREGIHAPEAE
ncbi:hypothetical protein GCM10010402_18020 [Actinomadura luteofluorescens]